MKNKTSGRSVSTPSGLALGALLSLILTIVGSAIIAKLVDVQMMGTDGIGYGIMVMLIIASYSDTTISCLKIKRRFLIVALLSAVIYLMILLAITGLFFGGQFSAVPETALLVVCGSMLAFLTVISQNKRVGKRKIKIRNR